jgi:hypothetical protein
MLLNLKKNYYLIFLILFSIESLPVFARNISYSGGWTVLENFNDDSFSVLIHHTLSPKISIGYRYEYFREEQWHLNALQGNILLKRWNMPDSQANAYLLTGVGVSSSNSDAFLQSSRRAGFAGVALDWENRQFFTSYENRYLDAKDQETSFNQKIRIGFAPYIGEYNDLHTWIMLETDHHDRRDDKVTWTPMVRFFKNNFMVELGWTIQGGPMTNIRILF